MTQMTPPPAQPGRSGSETEPPFLSLHTTVVLLTALVLGLIVGGLTALTDVPRGRCAGWADRGRLYGAGAALADWPAS